MNITSYPSPAKKYFSTKELLAFLSDYAGLTPTKSTVFKWSMQGFIPCRKAPNSRLLFPISDVIAWIESGNAQGRGQ